MKSKKNAVIWYPETRYCRIRLDFEWYLGECYGFEFDGTYVVELLCDGTLLSLNTKENTIRLFPWGTTRENLEKIVENDFDYMEIK